VSDDWLARAACAEVRTAVFFPAPHDLFAIEVARRICERCDVQAECLAYAVARPDLDGI
jgi:Transcription factor WhiB